MMDWGGKLVHRESCDDIEGGLLLCQGLGHCGDHPDWDSLRRQSAGSPPLCALVVDGVCIIVHCRNRHFISCVLADRLKWIAAHPSVAEIFVT